MLTLFGERHWDSPFVFTVFVALREKGIAFEERELDLARGDQKGAAYAGQSLTARVPAIDHDGFFLSESLAIVEYLEETFPEPRLLPASVRDRARARQVLTWLRSDLNALRRDRPTTTMFFARATTPLTAEGRADADKLVRVASQLVAGGRRTLFDGWSIADADLAFMLHRLILNDEPVPPDVRAHAAAHWERPSVRAFRDHPRAAL
jgi:glutathione S-transferase